MYDAGSHHFNFPVYETDKLGRVFHAVDYDVRVDLENHGTDWWICDVALDGRKPGERKDEWFYLADDSLLRSQIIEHAMTYERDEMEDKVFDEIRSSAA